MCLKIMDEVFFKKRGKVGTIDDVQIPKAHTCVCNFHAPVTRIGGGIKGVPRISQTICLIDTREQQKS